MILHTILPLEAVMGTPAESARPKCFFVADGLVETDGEGTQMTVRRLISTNPKAYLNPLYTPGSPFQANTPTSSTPQNSACLP